MGMWITILVVMSSILILMLSMPTQGSPPPDPFLPYADLLHRDSALDVVENGSFSCAKIFSGDRQMCSHRPVDRAFFYIRVTVEREAPHEVSFQVTKDALYLGDLVLLWGRPDTLFPYSAPTLQWSIPDGRTVSALVPSANRLNYLAPVQVVSFTF